MLNYWKNLKEMVTERKAKHKGSSLTTNYENKGICEFLKIFNVYFFRPNYKREELVDMDTVISLDFLPLYIYLESLRPSTTQPSIPSAPPGVPNVNVPTSSIFTEPEFAWIHRHAASDYNRELGIGRDRNWPGASNSTGVLGGSGNARQPSRRTGKGESASYSSSN